MAARSHLPSEGMAISPPTGGTETGVQQREREIRAEKEREAERERAKKAQAERTRLAEEAHLAEQARLVEQARVAEQAKRQSTIDEAAAKRAAAQKEADYAAWKASRKAGMRDGTANLRPDQVAIWNQAIAAWNKLSPGERETRFRREYEHLVSTQSKGGADLSKSCISDADWKRAQTQSASPFVSRIPGLEIPYARPSAPAAEPATDAAAAEAARQQAAAAEAARQQAAAEAQAQSARDQAAAQQRAQAQRSRLVAVPLGRDGGVYTLPVVLNGVLAQECVLDTGASAVTLPAPVFRALVAAGTIDPSDRLDDVIMFQADGIPQKLQQVRLRSVTVGGVTCDNVPAIIGTETAMPLLGQSFLTRFRGWRMDNATGRLILTP
jgi:predicted aspartyl protease